MPKLIRGRNEINRNLMRLNNLLIPMVLQYSVDSEKYERRVYRLVAHTQDSERRNVTKLISAKETNQILEGMIGVLELSR